MSEQAAEENLDPIGISQQQFARAIAHLVHLKAGLIEVLNSPKRTVSVHFPIEMSDGSVRGFQGYRVLHSNALARVRAAFVITLN